MSTKKFLTRYFHDGTWWCADIMAYDWADAEARCLKLGMQLDGVHVCDVRFGWLANAIIWIKNL